MPTLRSTSFSIAVALVGLVTAFFAGESTTDLVASGRDIMNYTVN